MTYAWKSHTEKDLSLEMHQVSKEIQLEYAKKIQKAQMSMDLNELQTIAIEMKQRIEDMLESYRAAAGAISPNKAAPAVVPAPANIPEPQAAKGRPLASVSFLATEAKSQQASNGTMEEAETVAGEDIHQLMKREVSATNAGIILPTPPRGLPAAIIPKSQDDEDDVLSTRRTDQSRIPTGKIRKLHDDDRDESQDSEGPYMSAPAVSLPPAGILAKAKSIGSARWESEDTNATATGDDADLQDLPSGSVRNRMTAAISDVANYAATAIASRWSDSTGSDLQAAASNDVEGHFENDHEDRESLASTDPEVHELYDQSHSSDSYSESESTEETVDLSSSSEEIQVEEHDHIEDAPEEANQSENEDQSVESRLTDPGSARQEKYKDFYAKNGAKIDLDIIVYDGDRDVIQGLLDEPEFHEIWHSIQSRGETYNARRDLLKSSLRLTKAMAPLIHRIAEKCKQRIGISADLEFYVHQDSQFNAMVYPPHNGRIYIMLTSSLLENFTETELEFVIGHELGHFLFNHFDFPVSQILCEGGGQLTPLQAMKLYSWKRNAEVSADRIGLMVCRDFAAVGRAFFKLSSGISDDSLTFQLNEYIDQFKELQSETESELVGPEDWYSTHPFSPLRIKALQLYEASESFFSAIGETGGTITEADMEQQIKEFMSIMEPAYLNDTSEGAAEVQKFVFFAGYAIAAANGTIDEEEIKALGSLIPEEIFASCMEEMGEMQSSEGGFDMNAIMEKVQALAEHVNVRIPVVGKLNIIKDLAIITYSDGSVEQCEIEVLYGVCHFLGIYTEFADRVLHDAGQGID